MENIQLNYYASKRKLSEIIQSITLAQGDSSKALVVSDFLYDLTQLRSYVVTFLSDSDCMLSIPLETSNEIDGAQISLPLRTICIALLTSLKNYSVPSFQPTINRRIDDLESIVAKIPESTRVTLQKENSAIGYVIRD